MGLLHDSVTRRRRKMAGRILRFQRDRSAHTAMYWLPDVGRRKGEAEEDMMKYIQRSPGRDWRQLACSSNDRQCR